MLLVLVVIGIYHLNWIWCLTGLFDCLNRCAIIVTVFAVCPSCVLRFQHIGWIPGPDFGALGMCSSHLKVVKGVMQPRTWENGPFWGVCDLIRTQRNELSQSKHMRLTIYTKGNIKWASYG